MVAMVKILIFQVTIMSDHKLALILIQHALSETLVKLGGDTSYDQIDKL